MDCCRAFISIIPNLPRDPKDMDNVDPTAEDHIYDESRYRVLAGNNRAARKMKFKKPH